MGLEHGQKYEGDGERGTRLLECLRGDARFRGAGGSLANRNVGLPYQARWGGGTPWVGFGKPIRYHTCVRGLI